MFYSMFMTWKLGTMLFFFTSVIFFFLFWNWVKKRLTGENICLCFFSARKYISPECYYRLVSYYNFVFCQLKRKKSFRKAFLASSQARKWITRKIKHEEKSHIFLSDLDQILQKPWGTSEDFFVLLVIHFLQPVFFSSVFVKLRTGKKKKKKNKKKEKRKKKKGHLKHYFLCDVRLIAAIWGPASLLWDGVCNDHALSFSLSGQTCQRKLETTLLSWQRERWK